MRSVLVVWVALFAGCAAVPESVRQQQIEGVKDMEAFGQNADKIFHRLVRKVEETANEKSFVQTELALEQETVEVQVLVKKATGDKPAKYDTRRYLPPEIVTEALQQLARLQKENDQAAQTLLEQWYRIKGDLRLALTRAEVIREALLERGLDANNIRTFSDALIDGLQRLRKRDK